ncbi:class I SAM-dependent methyltransferase [Phenylobacterium sp. J426]|uniref:class I SAM-dependent methyltransferase n=1 Tax=Phenylobacterium sp. J426 TaxID=2898439 RepID=UPI00215155F1|nr:class I SAM-dependent methyltransferase [Phenylobacterium sp. J426]MCR5875916.1 class I SAM-dependent methyltransferase [Phenylobacterium sp. J426]
MQGQSTALKPVDYDQAQHAGYAKARALQPRAIAWYMDAFAAYLPPERPLVGIDLGSGTGRFTPALADAFGGPVYGVEPAARMRETAEVKSAHPAVRYLAGHAAGIPLPDGAADFVLMFLSFHHYPDREAAVREIHRVLKPGGRAILRSTFRERIPNHWWRSYFPRSQQIEEAMFPSVAEARLYFEDRGFRTIGWETPTIPLENDLANAVEKLKLRAVSVFEHMSEDELTEGFAALDAALSAGTLEPRPTTGDYLVFARD